MLEWGKGVDVAKAVAWIFFAALIAVFAPKRSAPLQLADSALVRVVTTSSQTACTSKQAGQ
jgi:hypothetical protein